MSLRAGLRMLGACGGLGATQRKPDYDDETLKHGLSASFLGRDETKGNCYRTIRESTRYIGYS